MGQFEEKVIGKTELPSDVPSAKTAAGEHPDGAIFKSETGSRFRLRHARWVPVATRQRKAKVAATK